MPPSRLVALDEGPDIMLDRPIVVVGRHPACETRLDSLRVSRHHCCMTPENGEVVVRDLGSTNGIRINGQRVEMGRLRPGDELSIAHIRYRLENGQGHEQTIAEPVSMAGVGRSVGEEAPQPQPHPLSQPQLHPPSQPQLLSQPQPRLQSQPQVSPSIAVGEPEMVSFSKANENIFAAAVRKLLPTGVADKCQIQVIFQMAGDSPPVELEPDSGLEAKQNHVSENAAECRSDSSR